MHRRRFLQRAAVGAVTLGSLLPAWARRPEGRAAGAATAMAGNEFDLHVERARPLIDGRPGRAVLVNGRFPAPLLRWREGDEVVLNVTNHLREDTSIHWHGILLPFEMDGVPGVTFPGIAPGETFTYRFRLQQAGTYWYHSHSGLQEQLGHYGPIVIEPQRPDPVAFDREHVVVLSDWTFEDPHRVFARLKKQSDAYNRQQLTLADFFADWRRDGLAHAVSERAAWGAMRMNRTDLSDVTATTYTYLINGHGPAQQWQGLFRPGERVRLRFINASAMTIFNVRIPGLPMTVVQADGLNVQPVDTDEFQIGVAETYDVIVQPATQAYALVAESNDRSGLACATLTPDLQLSATAPPVRRRPLLTMKDMGMAHGDRAAMPASHGRPDTSEHTMHGHAHHADHGDQHTSVVASQAHHHARGPGVVGLTSAPSARLHERPLGLEGEPHRVLVYADLRSRDANPDQRRPERTLELHLTSNMERYMWSFDGVKFSDAEGPLVFNHGERLRLILVNDTMMPHPIHLHGMFFEVVTAEHAYKPRKHTIVVKPGERLAVDITADAVGDWAFHCHLLYHMHAGMMRVVSVRRT